MGVDQIILQAGQVLVTQSNSISGITQIPDGYQFGEIIQVSDIVNSSTVGQNVLFNPDTSISTFKISVTWYWIIEESLISLTEQPIL